MSEKKVKCPQCRKTTIYSETNKYRPFCSKRCKLIDLGDWADESYRIPDNEKKPSSSEDSPTGDDDGEFGKPQYH